LRFYFSPPMRFSSVQRSPSLFFPISFLPWSFNEFFIYLLRAQDRRLLSLRLIFALPLDFRTNSDRCQEKDRQFFLAVPSSGVKYSCLITLSPFRCYPFFVDPQTRHLDGNSKRPSYPVRALSRWGPPERVFLRSFLRLLVPFPLKFLTSLFYVRP